MNATTQLALLVKAKRVFETDGTFLSFPILSPLAYPPEKLKFIGPTADIPTIGEFSRLVNQIPRGTIFQQEDAYLWDVYQRLFDTAEVASSTATAEQVASYERARAVLYTTADGLQQDTPEYRAYRQCRDAWIAAAEEYKAAQLTAETSADPAVRERWQSTDEPTLRQKVAQAEATWTTDGFRAQVEEAERAIRAYNERPTAGALWDEWRGSLIQIIDELNDNPLFGAQSCFPTAYSPADAFDAQWPKFTLTADEVAVLVTQSPSELREVLDLSGTGPQVEHVSFEFRSVGLNRPWLRPDIFRARFWRLPSNETPLSDGGSPPQGLCPAYITGVVFARNIVEVTRQPGGSTDRIPIRTMPMLKLRADAVRPATSPVIGDHRATVRPAVVRDHRTAATTAIDTRAARMTVAGQPVAAPAAVRAVSPLARLKLGAFAIRPGPGQPTPAAPGLLRAGSRGPEVVKLQHALNAQASVVPKLNEDGIFGPNTDRAVRQFQLSSGLSVDGVVGPATWARLEAQASPPPPTTSPPSPDITILAFICRRLPRCPDPDPSLTWTR